MVPAKKIVTEARKIIRDFRASVAILICQGDRKSQSYFISSNTPVSLFFRTLSQLK